METPLVFIINTEDTESDKMVRVPALEGNIYSKKTNFKNEYSQYYKDRLSGRQN